MANLDNQQTWLPYENTKDCSKGFCSSYCPQWCYMVYPPPSRLGFESEDSGPNFSPLVIAIIGILASAFLLVSYYTIISKYCGNMDSIRRGAEGARGEGFNDGRSPSHVEPCQGSAAGLDEVLIKSIAVCKYRKGDGVVEGTDCSVCLNEFQEDECLRLLPKCSHAFHLPCIDMWLKCHSNCPLCRATVVPQLPPPIIESNSDHSSCPESRSETDTEAEDLERGDGEPSLANDGGAIPKLPLGAVGRRARIEIRDAETGPMRRSFSMDACQNWFLIADVLTMSMEENYRANVDHICEHTVDVIGPSKRDGEGEEHSNMYQRSRVLNSVMSPTTMKRSTSSGRFSLTRHGRVRNSALPI